jgi:uncharacterized protein YycO
MKQLIILFVCILSFSCTPTQTSFKDGDIIFQTSKSSQSEMLKMVTKSNLTHCGVIFHKNGQAFVFEAVQPVKVTPLKEWIKRGKNGKYSVTRLTYELSESAKKDMFAFAKKQLGKNYDLKFQWSENKMYCSELVWKIYNSSGFTLSDPKKFNDYDLSSESAKNAIKNRYNGNFNLNETVVSPVDLYNSTITEVIYSNY